jgi:glycosyltransferase involved in cell wall biosynthesis
LFGIVLIEAMACGTPVVATDCPGPVDVVSRSVGRIVAQDASSVVEEIEEAVLEINSDPEARRDMGERARERAVEEFSEQAVATQWSRLLAGKP